MGYRMITDPGWVILFKLKKGQGHSLTPMTEDIPNVLSTLCTVPVKL